MIKNLKVCDMAVQLSAEPPYRFTFLMVAVVEYLLSTDI